MRDDFADEGMIVETVRALEAADAALRPREWPALEDPQLRAMVSDRLRTIGRQLLPVTETPGGPLEGYVTGWSDDVVADLATGSTALGTDDLALLALIYLHSEILQRVLGEEVLPIREQLDAHTGNTGRDVIRGEQRDDSLRRLRAHQLITARGQLGPAFLRLGPSQRQHLEANLVLLLRPDSVWAREIRAAREGAAAREGTP